MWEYNRFLILFTLVMTFTSSFFCSQPVKANDFDSYTYDYGKTIVTRLNDSKYKIELTNTYKYTKDNELIINQWYLDNGIYKNKNNTFNIEVDINSVNINTSNYNLYYEPILSCDNNTINPIDIYIKSDRELIINYGKVKRSLWLSGGILAGYWIIDSDIQDIYKIKYNQIGNVKLKLGSNKIDNDSELLNVNGSKITLDTVSFNPDGDPETNTVDGWLYHSLYSQNAAWSSIHDATTADNFGDNNLDFYAINKLECGVSTDKWDAITRTIYLFDTSSIDDDYIVNSGNVTIRGISKGEYSSPTFDIQMFIVESSPASDTSLTYNDYDNFGDTKLSSGIYYDDWSTSAYNTFVLNGDGLDVINLTGITKFGLRFQYDIDDSPPTWHYQDTQYIGGYFSEHGSGYEPTLTLIVSEPPEPPEPPYNVSDNRTGIDQVTLYWTDNGTINGTSVNISVADENNWYNVYDGLDETCNISGLSLDILNYDVRLWSYNDYYDSEIVEYSIEYASESEGINMEVLELFSLIPLIIFLILSLIFRDKGLIHLTTFACSGVLAFIAITESYSILFFPIVAGTMLVSLILFMYCMAKGDWI